MARSTDTAITAYSEEQRRRIQHQLERMLRNTHFSHSKRFPSFLRFIVQEELEGRGDLLKERTLGMEVFGRPSGYDTTSDPIVRVTAAEIRKRIAQYYQEPGRAEELRISLPPGSYMPHFSWVESKLPEEMPLALETIPSEPEIVAEPIQPSGRSAPFLVRSVLRGSVITFVVLILICLVFWSWPRKTTLDRFWAPLLHSQTPLIVCFPRHEVTTLALRNAADPEQIQHLSESGMTISQDDLEPLVSLAGLLLIHHQALQLLGQDSASLTDLRRGPAIFLGAFDNAWTLRVTRGLRYRFGNDPEMKHFWIEDTEGTRTRWQVDRSEQMATNNYRDYAIVARFVDPNTGQPAIVSAGIARGGTVAAGEFLTQPGNMEAMLRRAPRDWDGKNMEFVLSTEIIDGRSAPPKIEAMYFW